MARESRIVVFLAAAAAAFIVAVYFLAESSHEVQIATPESRAGLSAEDLMQERLRLDETVWAQEVAAQKHEETLAVAK